MAATRVDLRVLQVLRPAAGGMVRHVAALSSGLGERGIAVAVAAPISALMTAGPVRLAVDHDVPIGPAFHPIVDIRCSLMLRRLSSGFDIVHAHGLRAALIAALAGSRSGTARIATAHNMPELHGTPARAAARMAIRRADAIVAVSQAVADQVVRLGADRHHIHVIPNGVAVGPLPDSSGRVSNRQSLGLPPDAFVIVGAGRLSPEKGFDVLISALPRVVADVPIVLLVLVGDGPARIELDARVFRSGLTPAVRLVGRVADVEPWLRAADVVVVPSRSEGQGLVALEAMAVGAPVVASRVGGLPEVVDDCITGLLVPPEDPDALATAISRLAHDPVLRSRLGQAGYTRVCERFAVGIMLDRVGSLYRANVKSLQGRGPLQAE